MPVDYQQIYARFKEIGAGAHLRRQELEDQRARARKLLADFANEIDLLRSKVEAAKAVDPNVRCALPLKEPLDAHYAAPVLATDATLIAADGSQINPDRHAAVQFGLVNVGAVTMRLNSGVSTDITTISDLLYGDQLETNFGLITDDMVALRRDLGERAALDDISRDIKGTVVTFTDGPIELWGAKGEDPTTYSNFVDNYKKVLEGLHKRGVITAGYVDKPSADLVLRLLEIASAKPEELKHIRDFRPFRLVSDLWLYGEKRAPMLPAGHRSAVFGLQSGSEKKYTGPLALCFFYLNVGTDGHPWPVRVEIPAWVAENREMLDLLHAVLVAQCRVMGHKPYPYLLHRAHETAVVKQDEKFQIEQMLLHEMRSQDEEIGDPSNKSHTKALPGRGSYGRRRS